jgi:hypothetical protein
MFKYKQPLNCGLSNLYMDIKFFKDIFRDKSTETKDVKSLPLEFVREIRKVKSLLSKEQYEASVNLVRKWIEYVREHKFKTTDDPFVIHFHLQKFIEREFVKEKEMPIFQHTFILIKRKRR